ncbi:MAG: DUF1302 domain-containing protein [Burkholderiales bacterium]|nr:DUF1302 domain-containing protein [Burkholderiales bacterium]
MIDKSTPRRSVAPSMSPVAAICAALLCGASARAGEIDLGNPDLMLRWDNTVKYSAAARLKRADPVLLANPNLDDGDRNFGKGLISSRLDWLSEADITWRKQFGSRISAAAWYDSVYLRSNDNPGFAGGAFPNQTSVPANEFTRATRDVHGRDAEVLDAFVFGRFELGDMNASLRAGRHSLLWGESLFFGGNAIAGGQMPVDVVKLVSVPGTQFKEAIRPLGMVSAQLQLDSSVSLGGYLQTQWRGNRVAAVGSYFSSADLAIDGGENMLLGPAGVAPRLADQKARNGGQGGLQLRVRGDSADYGVYLIRFHDKTPQLVPVMMLLTPPAVPQPTAVPSGYRLAYHEGIVALGASASRTFGDLNVALEASLRHNQDLASTAGADISAFAPVPPADNRDNPAYAVGRTLHLNLSTIASLPPTPLWREASLAAEIAWNRVLKVTKNAAATDPNATRDGVALRFVLEPTYRGVLPGVDLGVPLGVGWAPRGSRPLAMPNPNMWVADGGGDASLGINGSFRDVWRFGIAATHYFGRAATFNDAANAFTWQQSLRDRDFVAASLRYSF